MKQHQDIFCVDQMAKALGVSRSGYYSFLKRPRSKRALDNEALFSQIQTRSKRALDNEALFSQIQRIFVESCETYGSPRIQAELAALGIKVSRPRIARLMRASGLKAKMYRKFVKTTKRSKDSEKKTKDLVQRQFEVEAPNLIWVADISYVKVAQRWTYLAVVLDLFSRKIVGMAVEANMKVDLILKAFQMALKHRNPPKGLIHHSDLGTQYTSHDMEDLAASHGIQLSYGKSCFDNAVMESFFHTLKTEHVYFQNYTPPLRKRGWTFSPIFLLFITQKGDIQPWGTNPHKRSRQIMNDYRKTSMFNLSNKRLQDHKDMLPEARNRKEEHLELESFIQTRDQLVKLRVSLLNKVPGLFNRHGVKIKKEKLTTQKGFKESVAGQSWSSLEQVELEVIAIQLETIRESVKWLEKEITTFAETLPGYKNLISIKGIGSLSAAVLVSTIGDIEDFSKSGNLAPYLGIVPRVSQSNDQQRVGRIAKRGSKIARTTLVQCTLIAKSIVLISINFTNASRKKEEVERPLSQWPENSSIPSSIPSKINGSLKILQTLKLNVDT